MNMIFNPIALTVRATFNILIVFALMLSNFSALHSQSGFWTNLNPQNPPVGRINGILANVSPGKVLMFGGYNYDGHQNDIWLYDYSINAWSELHPEVSPKKRNAHGFCRLNDSLFLLFGGEGLDIWDYDDTWVFNINDTSWTEIKLSLHPVSRKNLLLSTISINKALLFGGHLEVPDDMGSNLSSETWIFDSEKMEWREIEFDELDEWRGIKPKRREECHSIAQIDEGKIMIYGGWAYTMLNDMWYFDLASETWTKMNPDYEAIKRYLHAMCKVSDKYVLLYGGADGSSAFRDKTWLLNFHDTTWKELELDKRPPGLSDHTLANLNENQVLLYGGQGKGIGVSNQTWLFTLDPVDVKEESKDIEFIQTSNYLIIRNIDESGGELYIYDIMGRTISNYSSFDISKSNEIRIPISHLNSGIYILKSDIMIKKFSIIK